MAEPIVERLGEFLSYMKLNHAALAELLGYSSGEKISRLFRKEGALPSAEIIADVANKFAKELSLDWWITGQGAMLKPAEKGNLTDQRVADGVPKDKYITLLETTLNELREERKQIQQSLNELSRNQRAIASIALATQDVLAELKSDLRKVDLKLVRRQLGKKAMQYFETIGKTDIFPVKDK